MNALSTTLRVLAIIGALAALGLWIQLGDQKEKLIKEGRVLTTQRDNLQTDLNTTTATLTETKSKLDTKTDELKKNIDQLELTTNSLDETSKERDSLKATLAERDATIVDRDAKVASMQEEIGMLNEKIAAAVTKDMYDKSLAATEAARKEIADKDVKISELAHKLSLAEARLEQSQRAIGGDTADDRIAEWRHPLPSQHMVDGGAQIRSGIEQGAIQIEQDGGKTAGRWHGFYSGLWQCNM